MRHIAFRLFLIIIFWFFLLSYVVPWSNYWIQVPFSGSEYKLWLDLQWWIELDYKVDLEEVKKDTEYDNEKEKQIIEWLKSIIDKRVETLNINDSVITSADYAWEQHIIVQIPLKWNNSLENSENIKKAKAAIWKVVKIEFKERRTEITEQDLNDRKILAESAVSEINETKNFSVVADKYKLTHENVITWELIDPSTMFDVKSKDIVANKLLESKQISSNESWYLIFSEKIDDNYSYIFISKTPSEWMSAKDTKWRILDDKYFVKSSVQFNQAFTPMIELTFNDEWAKIFWELSSRLVWKEMAIFVWWELLTAPTINEAILWWKAVITWNYTPEEAKALSQDINTWVVPAPIYLTSEKTIDSKLWDSSLQKMIVAWLSGFILILLFLVIVYRFAWFISAIALLMYVMLVLTVVKSMWIVLTLASVAWLILSIGMAIDANILVFERVKDELREWKSLSEATSRWFTKSWSAIWDSNVTWLIVALILFIFGINMIKWFWLMLAIWIIVSLFSVMWISRILLMLFADTMKSKNLFIWIKK